MQRLLTQLERLDRHYQASIRHYDLPTLLDLSNVLRIFAELKESLPEILPKEGNKQYFQTGTPTKKLRKKINDAFHIVSYLPGGVTTYSAENIGKKILDIPRMPGNMTASCRINTTETGLCIHNFCVANKDLEQKEFTKLVSQGDIKKCNFNTWLCSEAIRLNVPHEGKFDKIIISREHIMKRVANSLEGSHTSLKKDHESKNKFDNPIKHLFDFYYCGGLPLPYYLLLKISHDILENFPKMIKAQQGGN